jgi:hypothetical protein
MEAVNSRPQLSQDLDRVGRHPDVNLLEASLQPLLEIEKELAMFRLVRYIHENPHQVIAE